MAMVKVLERLELKILSVAFDPLFVFQVQKKPELIRADPDWLITGFCDVAVGILCRVYKFTESSFF